MAEEEDVFEEEGVLSHFVRSRIMTPPPLGLRPNGRTVLSARNKIVLSFKDSPKKPLGR